jgi:hypothetical protein
MAEPSTWEQKINARKEEKQVFSRVVSHPEI